MKKQNIIYCLIICFTLGCKITTKDLLHKEWYGSEWVKNGDSVFVQSVFVTRLYKDGTYSQYSYKGYMFGKWSWDKTTNEITIIPEKGSLSKNKMIYLINFKSTDEIQVRIKGEYDSKMLGAENEYPWKGNVNKSAIDPFSPAMNAWRIKPASKETTEELGKRTKQYLQFLSAYYQHTSDNKFKLLLNGWYPRPIFMHYGNGCRMAYNNELSDWYPCFYDTTQAVDAYKLIGGALRKTKIPKEDDKAKRNREVLNEMIKHIQ